MFYSPQGDYRHLKAYCPNLTNEDPANVEEGPSQLPDCPLCLLMGQHQILPKALSAFREALGEPRREVEVSCYFFGFDHPTKLAFRLDQDWGGRPVQLPPRFFYLTRSVGIRPLPGTSKTSDGGPSSAGGADAVFACAAHRADSTQGGASVLHCDLFNIP